MSAVNWTAADVCVETDNSISPQTEFLLAPTDDRPLVITGIHGGTAHGEQVQITVWPLEVAVAYREDDNDRWSPPIRWVREES